MFAEKEESNENSSQLAQDVLARSVNNMGTFTVCSGARIRYESMGGLNKFCDKGRYIPVELWAGAEWDGKKELRMPKVDGTYRHRNASYQIKGPTEWEHPSTGRKFLVYERINPGKDGVKLQLFTINQDQNGLGRLYDGRPGRDGRLASGGLKFPLGLWKEGETRKFVYQVWGSREAERVESITIQQIDFVFQGSSHCLEFYWTATSRSGGTVYDRQTYVYCPGKSMISQMQH